MSENWDEHAGAWDDNEDVISYSNKAFETLLRVVELGQLRVLDFGCGTGLLAERMSPLATHIVALDSSPKMISVLESKALPNVTTLAESITESLIAENESLSVKFDLITASSVCAFLPSFEKTLSLLTTLLVPGGFFVQWDWLTTQEDAEFGLTAQRVEEAYNQAGLSIVSLGQAFDMVGSEAEDVMPVLMGVAQMPKR